MNQTAPRHHLITVGTDGSQPSDRAVRWAAREALRRGCPLEVVHVVDEPGSNELALLATAGVSPSAARTEADAVGRTVLDATQATARAECPEVELRPVLVVGDAREVLLARAPSTDLIVVGSRGRGRVRSLLLGSVGVTLVRRATTPVVVIHVDGRRDSHRVLVGSDGGASSLGALRVAFQEAAWRDASLTVVSCTWAAQFGPQWFDVPSTDVFSTGGDAVNDLLLELRAEFPEVDVQVRLTRGRADLCLIELADVSDLLVLGRLQTSALDEIGLGSMVVPVVERTRAPVLVVPIGTPAVVRTDRAGVPTSAEDPRVVQ